MTVSVVDDGNRVRLDDEWQVSERRYLSEGSMSLIDAEPTEQPTPEITQEVATTALIASYLPDPPRSRTHDRQ